MLDQQALKALTLIGMDGTRNNKLEEPFGQHDLSWPGNPELGLPQGIC